MAHLTTVKMADVMFCLFFHIMKKVGKYGVSWRLGEERGPQQEDGRERERTESKDPGSAPGEGRRGREVRGEGHPPPPPRTDPSPSLLSSCASP